MSLESQIDALVLPHPQGTEDVIRYTHRIALIGAYIGAAYGVANTPPSVSYLPTGEPDRNDLLRHIYHLVTAPDLDSAAVEGGIIDALRSAGLPVDRWEAEIVQAAEDAPIAEAAL